MINYGLILSKKEKDNPNPFLRATYLFGNVGKIIRTYGRSVRFPEDSRLYLAEIKTDLGDAIMQLRLIEVEYGIQGFDYPSLGQPSFNPTLLCSSESLIYHSYNSGVIWHPQNTLNQQLSQLASACSKILLLMSGDSICISRDFIQVVIDAEALIYQICLSFRWDFYDVEHLGFIHTIDCYEGWWLNADK